MKKLIVKLITRLLVKSGIEIAINLKITKEGFVIKTKNPIISGCYTDFAG